MSENRRLSTRNRGEPPIKKRALTPPPAVAASAPPRTAEQNEEGLPTKLIGSRPLPVLPKRQDMELSDKAFQTISESGVLAASIERSRQKWSVDGIFERYWTKPSKKNPMMHGQNPAKETMTRLGNCSIIIDPHVFEAILYTVKDIPTTYPPSTPQPPSLSAPQYNPFPHYGTYASYPNNAPPSAPHPPHQPQQHTHSSQPSLPPFREGFGSFGPQGPPPIHHQPITHPAPPPPPKPPTLSRSGSTNHATQGESIEAKPDPVIQMLATRAASNQGLKTLMKVVASGRADPAQLKEFQSHIDELNSILQSGGHSPPPFGNDGSADVVPHDRSQQLSRPPHASTPSSVSWDQGGSYSTRPQPYQGATPIKAESLPQAYPMAASPMSTKGYDKNKSDIDGVVFELGGTVDRFSFPRFSILEYLYGGTQVIVSFLVIRRGSTAASGKYKGTMSYYQPVTMRLTCPNPKVLEPLARVVAPPDEVRRYMDDYFDKLSPAETVYLAPRLPRANDAEEVKDQAASPMPDTHTLKPVYLPPDSIMPLAA